MVNSFKSYLVYLGWGNSWGVQTEDSEMVSLEHVVRRFLKRCNGRRVREIADEEHWESYELIQDDTSFHQLEYAPEHMQLLGSNGTTKNLALSLLKTLTYLNGRYIEVAESNRMLRLKALDQLEVYGVYSYEPDCRGDVPKEVLEKVCKIGTPDMCTFLMRASRNGHLYCYKFTSRSLAILHEPDRNRPTQRIGNCAYAGYKKE